MDNPTLWILISTKPVVHGEPIKNTKVMDVLHIGVSKRRKRGKLVKDRLVLN
jgi:hypothetical protein